MNRTPFAVISTSALKHNLNRVRAIAPGKKIIAMVKADGYGHGLITVAKALDDVDALGVARLEEGIILRKAGVITDVILMEGLFSKDELKWVQEYGFIQVVHSHYQLQALKEFSQEISKPFDVWLKINTGMNRLGFLPREIDAIVHQLQDNPAVRLIGFMTHFPRADEKSNDFLLEQAKLFRDTITEYGGMQSLANSAAILSRPETHGDWIRPGLMLYGASPFCGLKGFQEGLVPAMELQSELIAIQHVPKGGAVGYGCTWINQSNDAKIGIVAMGYGDGYPWHAQNGTPVLIHGKRVPLVGRVSMDMLAVDISGLPQAKVGDQVTLWGKDLPIEDIAEWASTIPYELFCRLTERVAIKVVN